MSVLFSLSDELCRVLISDWMDLPELTVLDTAVCSHQFRDQLLSFLPYAYGYCCSHSGLEMLKWMNARNIEILELVLDEKTGSPDWMIALTQQWENVVDLVVMIGAKINWTNLNSCLNLASLQCERGVNFDSVNGAALSKLTVLSIWEKLSLPSLIAVRDNCQLLKCLSIICTPTASTTPVMIDILRQNSQLIDVDIEINKPLMEALVSYCSHSLKKICVRGRVDFNTIRYIQEKCVHYETIVIKSGHDGDLFTSIDVTYCKVQHSLSLWWFHEIAGWHGFVAQLPSLRKIVWDRRLAFDMTVEPELSSHQKSLREIVIKCTNADSSALKSLLNHCTVLKIFSCATDKAVNWPEVLCDDYKLEQLTIRGPCNHMIEILKSCRYLTTLTFEHNTRYSNVASLIDAIRNYRHCITGQSLVCNCQFNSSKTLFYDGGEFSGSQWDEYYNIAKDRIKELEEELKSLKDRLAQKDEK